MPLNKENIINFLPNGFETQNKEGYKTNFSDDKIQVGYEKDIKERVTGPNFNNLLDVIGKNFNTLYKFLDYFKNLKIGQTPIVDNNNQLNSTTIGVKVHNLTETFGLGEWVVGTKDNKKTIFESLQSNNVGHALTDTNYWQEVNIGGGYPLLHIGFSLFVNEALGLDRYLNGQLVAINDNYKPALAELKKLKSTSPSLFTTEENWQAEKLLSHYGQVGKFVIADDESTLRLPAIVNIQGLLDLQNLGLRVDAGLPNITGNIWNVVTESSGTSGCITATVNNPQAYAGGNGKQYRSISIDASLSSPIYKDDCETVQIEAIQYPFFIRLATGQETEVNIVNEIELNNPYSLLESKYSESKLNNASWLRSEGQKNSKAVYVTAYEALQVEQNVEITEGQTVELPSGSSYTKRGLSVKLSSEEYTDYDFVLNTSNETFRLPLKSNLASSNFAKGNGKTLGMTNGSSDFVFRNSDVSQYLGKYTDTLGASTQIETVTPYGQAIGVSTDSTKSGIELDTEKVYLYYYVGETVQNANLINAGRIEEKLVDKVNAQQAAHSAMPSGKYIDLSYNPTTINTSGLTRRATKYQALSDGWITLGVVTSGSGQQIALYSTSEDFSVDDNLGTNLFKVAISCSDYTASANSGIRTYIPVKKGSYVYSITSSTNTAFIYRFTYCEGAIQ